MVRTTCDILLIRSLPNNLKKDLQHMSTLTPAKSQCNENKLVLFQVFSFNIDQDQLMHRHHTAMCMHIWVRFNGTKMVHDRYAYQRRNYSGKSVLMVVVSCLLLYLIYAVIIVV